MQVHDQAQEVKKFSLWIEDREFFWGRDTITIPEIRKLGNLTADQPVVEILQDNTEQPLSENAVIELKPGRRFGKKIRFKRG